MENSTISEIDLKSAAERMLAQTGGAMAVMLFGSRARGDHRPDSDWDIAVITDGEDRNGKFRYIGCPDVFRSLPGRINVLALPFETLRRKRNSAGYLAVSLAREGRVLAGDMPEIGKLEKRPYMNPEKLAEKLEDIWRIIRIIGREAAETVEDMDGDPKSFGKTLVIESANASELFVKMVINRRTGKHLWGHDLHALADKFGKRDREGSWSSLVDMIRSLNGYTRKHHQGMYDDPEITQDDIRIALERFLILLPAIRDELENAKRDPVLADTARAGMTRYGNISRRIYNSFPEMPDTGFSDSMIQTVIETIPHIRAAFGEIAGMRFRPDKPEKGSVSV